MRDLGRRVLVGLAAAVAIVAAVGYGLIATNIASPIGGDLGTVAVPDSPGARAVLLADGRPAFVVRTDDAIHVLDARVPRGSGSPGGLAVWCAGYLFDPVTDAVFEPDGAWLAGAASDGLIAYPVQQTDAGRVSVGRDGSPAGERDGFAPPAEACDAVMHEPEAGEVFDPSVAADEEPPGWIWLEGRLQALGGQVLLCDDLQATDCPTGAVVPGIDPAQLASLPDPLNGLFLGRIGDGVIDELHYVPRG